MLKENKIFMKKIIYGSIFVLIFSYLTVCGYYYASQADILFLPEKTLKKIPSDSGLRFEEINMDTPDGCKINAWYLPCPGSMRTILFCHGNAGNMSNGLGSLEALNKLGHSAIIFDYRGYGKSTGTSSEQGLYTDAETVWEYAVSKLNIPPETIVLWGRSLGGAVAAELAFRRKPAALVMESTFTSIPDMASYKYPFLPSKILCHLKFDSFSKIGKVKCPKLFLHSPEDSVVPYRFGVMLFEKASGPKKFIEMHGDHNARVVFTKDNYVRAIKNFISEFK